MKFYCIPPNNHLDMMDNGDRYFGLAHIYHENENTEDIFCLCATEARRFGLQWIVEVQSIAS